MRAWATAVSIAAAVAAFSCGSAEDRSEALGAELTLRAGQATPVGGEGLAVGFVRVVEDSRCPSDVACVQAGRVVAELELGASRLRLEPGQAAAAGSYRVRLVRVEPSPSSAAPIPASRYEATVVVDRL